jgi:poly(A) polymerase
VEGRKDVEQKTIRTIGNPEIRMREDPVRILRAIRFASRLQMHIESQTYAAMENTVGDLSRCAPARLLEEVFRLLRSGASRQAFKMLYSLGALELLLPPVAKHLRKTGEPGTNDLFSRLGALDARTKLSRVDDSIIVAMLLSPLAQNQQGKGCGSTIDSLLENMVQTARLSRRLADRTRQLLWAQGVLVGENRRRRSLSSFRSHPMFLDSLLLLEMDAEATGESRELVEKWRTGALTELSLREGNRRRKRRPRGGRNSLDKRSVSSSTT